MASTVPASEDAMSTRSYIVTVHGVGDCTPAQTLDELSQRFRTEYERTVKVVNGIDYPMFHPTD